MHRPPFLLSITLTYTVSTVAGEGRARVIYEFKRYEGKNDMERSGKIGD